MSGSNYDAWGVALWKEVKPHHDGVSTLSRALLHWFLIVYYQLEPIEADEALCDSSGDQGIDAIVVDSADRELIVLQAKWREKHGKAQGNKDLKSFVGNAHYFESVDGIDSLLSSKPNEQLILLLDRVEARQRIEDGYRARMIFVTNGVADASARSYMQSLRSTSQQLELFDLTQLGPLAEYVAKPGFVQARQRLTANVKQRFESKLSPGVRVVFASVPAADIVKLPGITDRSLFDLNVRLGLGKRSRVNRELTQTIRDKTQHSGFLAYHNGLTILCERIILREADIGIENFSVVNGCQSVLAMHDERANLTPALRLLVRLVEVGSPGELAARITYRTNNQNSVSPRDQRANDPRQQALKNEVLALYGDRLDYLIRRGETPAGPAWLQNDEVAQLLLAFYRREPWNAVRRAVLFDDEWYRYVFPPRFRASHIYAVYLVSAEIDARRKDLSVILQSNYALSKIVTVYLVSCLLDMTAEGRAFKDDPRPVLESDERGVRTALGLLVREAMRSVNDFLEDRIEEFDSSEEQSGPYDYKIRFKSQTELQKLRRWVVRDFGRAVDMRPELAFRYSAESGRKSPRRVKG